MWRRCFGRKWTCLCELRMWSQPGWFLFWAAITFFLQADCSEMTRTRRWKRPSSTRFTASTKIAPFCLGPKFPLTFSICRRTTVSSRPRGVSFWHLKKHTLAFTHTHTHTCRNHWKNTVSDVDKILLRCWGNELQEIRTGWNQVHPHKVEMSTFPFSEIHEKFFTCGSLTPKYLKTSQRTRRSVLLQYNLCFLFVRHSIFPLIERF